MHAEQSHVFTQVNSDVCVSNVTGISLADYAYALPHFCKLNHPLQCARCPGLVSIAQSILTNGFVPLSEAFRATFPNVSYHSHSAKRLLLQLPLVAVRIGQAESGLAQVCLFEHHPGVRFLNLLERRSKLSISKAELGELLNIAQCDHERETISYAVYKASGLSATGARKHLGLNRMLERAQRIQNTIGEVQSIRSAIDSLCHTQEKATLNSFGINVPSSSSSEESETAISESDTDTEGECEQTPQLKSASQADLVELLRKSAFNWFQFVDSCEEMMVDSKCVEFESLIEKLTTREQELVVQSHDAFCHVEEFETPREQREASAFNGSILSESESDNPDDYLTLSLHSSQAKTLIQKKIKAIRRKSQRDKAKAIAEKNFLNRKKSKKVKSIAIQFPDIGKTIENFVEQRSVGADAWRRTGVLTFDGNRPIKEKVTYFRIKQHLEAVYKRKFAYGTVVQLCIPRNKRRLSAKRYRGVAKVTTRRARKGFQLRYNPDQHWSSALYRGLNYLQHTDGSKIVNINRDDAAGFRLDTLSTHRLHRTPVVQGKEILTTRTDFVNSYPSLLQTSSYNFSATKTTGELCCGVVKGSGIYPKNAAQHSADLTMLESVATLEPAFFESSTGLPKVIECVRVDGATDEGPSHLEVQFWWTLRHLCRPTFVTLVTTRNSGGSYLNRVELQNGCLALAHSNLFIPSNLNGSCFDPETGKVDQTRLKANLDRATDIYIERCNGSPCGDTQLQLFKGADSSENQELRKAVLIFLKGTKKEQEKLKQDEPEVYKLIEQVWTSRSKHMQPDLPSQYIFYLKCCRSHDCSHPLCQKSNHNLPSTWFLGGPPLTYLPLPVPDPSQPWGSLQCSKCEGMCYGHYLEPSVASSNDAPSPMQKPPSQMLKEWFDNLRGKTPSNADFEVAAKVTLLPPGEVEIWFQHLLTVQQNRKRGAEKAAATRRQKRGQTTVTVFRCLCGKAYEEETDTVEQWIECEQCKNWFHFDCVGVNSADIPEHFFCTNCSR